MKNSLSAYFENLVTLAVVLVLFQTLAEDVFVLFQAPWVSRRLLLYTSFGFDIFFTVEFLVRSWVSLCRREFGNYFLRSNGWVDFLASVPLLLFFSGPTLFSILSGYVFGGRSSLLGVLKIVKIVRMARLLRLLRLLKIFGRIRFTGSFMVQRHAIRLTTMAATTIILSVTLIGGFFTIVNYGGVQDKLENHKQLLADFVRQNQQYDGPEVKWNLVHPDLIKVKKGLVTVYERHNNSYLSRFLSPADYNLLRMDNMSIWFDMRRYAVEEARLNLTVFLMTLLVVAVLIVAYTTHFAVTVSDPINIMIRGLERPGYNLEVQIPQRYSEDDVFRLSSLYNNEYLPMKDRSRASANSAGLDISVDDIGDLIQ